MNVASQSEARFVGGLEESVPRILASSVRPTVLAYHELTFASPAYRYALACHDFEEHVQLAAQLKRANAANPPLVISFDDGHISNYVAALPVLQKHSCKAIFFVIVGRIGTSGFMSWEQLNELVALGHQVSAHGWSHRFLTGCSDAELDIELVRSREELQNKLGIPVESLSAPHGRWNRRVALVCAEAGYRRLYTSSPWAMAYRLGELEIMGRLMVTRSMDSARLARWLTMGRLQAGVYRGTHVLKQSVRHVLGNDLYHRLWTRFAGWDGPNDI
jgi:peptidoglycan/xylan/chitin deacetylase (PgdA/CDA1 family)